MAKSAGSLRQRDIDDLQPRDGKQYVEWESDTPGFGVRVSPGGTKTFVLKYRLKSGRVRWKSIGRVDDMTLAEARGHATDDRGTVARGKDPSAETDRARGAVTVSAAATRFLADYVEANRKPSTLRSYKQAIDSYIRPWLGAIPLIDLTNADVEKMHHRLRSTPYAANRAVAVMSKLCSWSKIQPNPCEGIEHYAEKKRKRYLDRDEYAKIGKALRAGRQTGAYPSAALTGIELALLTGCRPSEIASLQWKFVDSVRGVINLPESKTGEKIIYLSAPALKLLKRWPRFEESPYVFPGNGRRQRGDHMHPSTLTHTFQALREAAGISDDLRLYDACRHSFASVAISDHGLSLAQIGEQLGHSQAQTTKRYTHLHDTTGRQNADAVGGTIAAALKRKIR